MQEKKICISRVIKNVSYFLAPVILLALIVSTISVIYVYRNSSAREKDYFKTSDFAFEYKSLIEVILKYPNSNTNENYEYYSGQKQTDIEIYYHKNGTNFIYLIVDEKQNKTYTNVEDYTSRDELKKQIMSNKIYWVYENKTVDTTVQKLSKEIVNNANFYNNIPKDNIRIYTAILDDLPNYDVILEEYVIHSIIQSQYRSAIYMIPIYIILLILMFASILIGIGKTRKEKGIHLNWFDKVPIGICALMILLADFISIQLLFLMSQSYTSIIEIIVIGIILIILYISIIAFFETFVKRIKTNTLFKTTLIYYLYSKLKYLLDNMKLSLKVGIYLAGFLIANLLILGITKRNTLLRFIFFMGFYALTFIYVLKQTVNLEKMKKMIQDIYQGNVKEKLNENEMKGSLKVTAMQINNIADGLSNAIEEKLKSERFKTELITNVSHDIKTPLTSIINYVDLLKKEGITDEKAEEYLAILDNKSQRLKKLTEDLLEASKASSGNIKMNMEKLEVNELMKQVSAEFADKFKAKELKEEINFTKEPVYIKADSRYMYRVLENLYSNISKYALENSRVYVDLVESGNDIIIQIKNISKQKLNISADELMQRFVRGDVSRNTEGSGLGLSIARSLTELQKGQFNIYLDGDLFKITIDFKKEN